VRVEKVRHKQDLLRRDQEVQLEREQQRQQANQLRNSQLLLDHRNHLELQLQS
jgi:hypothetical protein